MRDPQIFLQVGKERKDRVGKAGFTRRVLANNRVPASAFFLIRIRLLLNGYPEVSLFALCLRQWGQRTRWPDFHTDGAVLITSPRGGSHRFWAILSTVSSQRMWVRRGDEMREKK